MPGELWHIDQVELAAGGSPEAKRAYATLVVKDAEPSRGGLGETRRVTAASGQVLACKRMLLPDRSGFATKEAYDAEVANRARAFREEYEALRRLSNFKGFVKAHAYGLLQGCPVILMEWVEGASLADVSETRGPLAALTVAQIGRDVFHLLARLEWQAELFVHRDLSPANIMLRTSERPLDRQLASGLFDVCLIDFGSAATLRSGDGAFTTDTRILRGATPAYAAPEMLTSDVPGLSELRKSSKIDAYAACSVLYELLCGRPPFNLGAGASGSDYLQKMTHDPLPSGFPEGSAEWLLAQTVCQGIRPLQDDRPSAYALFKALSQFCDDYDGIVELARAGLSPELVDMRAIDHPDLNSAQVALSNPIAHQVAVGVAAPPSAQGSSASSKRSPQDLAEKKAGGRRGKHAPTSAIAAAAVAAVAALVVIAVFAAPSLLGGQTNARDAGSQAPAPPASAADADSSAEATAGGATSSPEASSGPYAWLMGTWSGNMVSTSANPSCFGASQADMTLTVQSVDNSVIDCDVRLVYHGHNRRAQTGDAASNAGDAVQEWDGVRASFDDSSFTLKIDETAQMGRNSSLSATCKVTEGDTAMDVAVTSLFQGAETVDEYVLER